MKRNAAVLIILLRISTTGYAQQQTSEKMPIPEYYGIYAVVNGRLLKLDEPDKPPKSIDIQLGHRAAIANVLNGAPVVSSDKVSVTEFPADVTFLLFYQRSELMGPLVLAKELKLRGFPYIRNVTVDSGWPSNVRRSGLENAWDSSRPTELLAGLGGKLLTTRIELRVKPIQGQPDMVLAVPSSKLTGGVYELSGEEFKPLLFAVSPVAEGAVAKCADVSYAYGMVDSTPDSKPCAPTSATQQAAGVLPASGQGTVSSKGQPSSASAASIPPCGDYDACVQADTNSHGRAISAGGHYVNEQDHSEYLDLGSDGKFFWKVGGREFTGSYEISGDILTLRFPPVDATARGKLASGQFNCCLSNGLDPTASALIDDESKNWVWQNAQEQSMHSRERAKSVSASSVELKEGQTPEEVEKLIGKPNDTMMVKGSLIYIYPTVKVIFENHKLVDVQYQQQ